MSKNWFTWDYLENAIETFDYKGKDCNSKPAPMYAKKMKNKNSRNIIGVFFYELDRLK